MTANGLKYIGKNIPKTNNVLKGAFLLGQIARDHGRPKTSCPFKYKTTISGMTGAELKRAWLSGWNDFDREIDT